MNLIQFLDEHHSRRVGVADKRGETVTALCGVERVYDLVLKCLRDQTSLTDAVMNVPETQQYDYAQLLRERRVLPPLDHPDAARCTVTGTGLTHLGSAHARDQMHAKLAQDETLTDSMRLFRWGLEGGKPKQGVGCQPEWFYKGDGQCIVPPEGDLTQPPFALDGGEEAEVVGLYVIGTDGTVHRVGFALGNEFADHDMEQQNYLYLAHSKLRPCAFGPELRLGELPAEVRGRTRLMRSGQAAWEDDFLSGELHMSHALANLEHHHFKYAAFRRPGDVHVHFFGASSISFSSGLRAAEGDVFEISAEGFGRPLRNTLRLSSQSEAAVTVRVLT